MTAQSTPPSHPPAPTAGLGASIRAARTAGGLTQQALGARLGVAQSTVGQWEREATAPTLDHFLAMTRAFGVGGVRLLTAPAPTARLGTAIRAARTAAGLTQDALAARLGVAQSSVAQWEREMAAPTLDHFLAMTHAFGVGGAGLLTAAPGRLGASIRARRRAAGLSQEELAGLLGVLQSSVAQWERGATAPTLDHFLAMTHAFGVGGVGLLAVEAGASSGVSTDGQALSGHDMPISPPA